ncbi:MAG TPA: hypothetical protein DIV79_03855 [Opitutae bacterium]|nr:hypothetical protein [Verrucomicrobiota bacterium]HCR29133.1 hypothetical protein [Opitutae bacterium]|tara:strand:+ start:199 stop:570 length:372 start_codon:yes stop_codon:yes gene_type:complete
MPDDVSLDEVNGLNRVKSIGIVPVDEWRKSFEKILALKEEHRINCLLIDSKEQMETSDYGEILEFAKTIPKDLKLAFLVEDISGGKAQTTEPKIRFLEAVGSKEELDVRSFIDEDEALKWLKN